MNTPLTPDELQTLCRTTCASAIGEDDRFNTSFLRIPSKTADGSETQARSVAWSNIKQVQISPCWTPNSLHGSDAYQVLMFKLARSNCLVDVLDASGGDYQQRLSLEGCRLMLSIICNAPSPPAVYIDSQVLDQLLNGGRNCALDWDDEGVVITEAVLVKESTGSQLAKTIKNIPWETIGRLDIEKSEFEKADFWRHDRLTHWLSIKCIGGDNHLIPLIHIGDRARFESFIHRANSLSAPPIVNVRELHSDEEQIVVRFWPHSEVDRSASEKEKLWATWLVMGFVFVWAFGALASNYDLGRFSILVRCLQVVPLILIPLFARGSSATQMTFQPDGIRSIADVAGTVSTKRFVAWKDIQEIYLTPRKNNQRLLDRQICFQPQKGPALKLKLENIATAKHWSDLLHAISHWSSGKVIDIDPDLFDNLNVSEHDPSYTQLWLDALLAPPRREKLQALSPGTGLKKGEYLLERKLGAGGQGSAYLARTKAGVSVVLKESILPLYVDNKVRRQALENFEHEASILRTLKHPNIVTLLDCFIEDHRGYLVLEHIDGLNLRQYVAKNGPLEVERVCDLAVTMCDVLSYLHQSSPPVVHRDFTPDNLILRADGSLKLIDFMVAQQNTDTATATVVGKHAYLPPEQFRGKATTQSDIYALGCTLNYLLTGNDPEPLLPSHPIIERNEIASALDEIVATCTALELDKRYPSAHAVGQALNQL